MKKQILLGILLSLLFIVGVSSAAPTIERYSGDEGEYRFVNNTDSIKLYFVTDAPIAGTATVTVIATPDTGAALIFDNISKTSPYMYYDGVARYVDLSDLGLDQWEYYNVSMTVTYLGDTSEPIYWRVRTSRTRAVEAIEKMNETAYNEFMFGIEDGNVTRALSATVIPYTQVLGNWFWLIICGIPFIYIFMATGRMSIPATAGIALAAIGIGLFPANFQIFIAVALVLSLGGAFYAVSKSQ